MARLYRAKLAADAEEVVERELVRVLDRVERLAEKVVLPELGQVTAWSKADRAARGLKDEIPVGGLANEPKEPKKSQTSQTSGRGAAHRLDDADGPRRAQTQRALNDHEPSYAYGSWLPATVTSWPCNLKEKGKGA